MGTLTEQATDNPYWRLFHHDNGTHLWLRRPETILTTDAGRIQIGHESHGVGTAVVDRDGLVRCRFTGTALGGDWAIEPPQLRDGRQLNCARLFVGEGREHQLASVYSAGFDGPGSPVLLYFDQDCYAVGDDQTIRSARGGPGRLVELPTVGGDLTLTTQETPGNDPWTRLDEALKQAAADNDLCEAYERFVARWNHDNPEHLLSPRDREYLGSIAVTFHFRSPRNGDARAEADVIRLAISQFMETAGFDVTDVSTSSSAVASRVVAVF